jgi:hypothetical protein
MLPYNKDVSGLFVERLVASCKLNDILHQGTDLSNETVETVPPGFATLTHNNTESFVISANQQ